MTVILRLPQKALLCQFSVLLELNKRKYEEKMKRFKKCDTD
jgi:hypothetical protein